MLVVVKDGVGFYVNCILVLYMNEVVNFIFDGEFIEYIDKLLVKFGFFVGFVKLFDEVGIDVGIKIILFFVEVFGECFIVLSVFDKVFVDGRKGKKN